MVMQHTSVPRKRRLVTLLSLAAAHSCLGIRPQFQTRHPNPKVHERLLWPTSNLFGMRCGGDSTIDSEEAFVAESTLITDSLDANVVGSADAAIDEPSHDDDDVSVQENNIDEDESKPSTDDDIVSFDAASIIAEKSIQEFTQLRNDAAEKRAEGKTLHDSGDLASASKAFHEAASLLSTVLQQSSNSPGGIDSISLSDHTDQISEEFATCRLHEALCLFKNGEAERCVQVCTDVLGDGTTVEHDDDVDSGISRVQTNIPNNGQLPSQDADTENEDGDKCENKAARIITTDSSISAQVRARAHLRRSKARLKLGDLDGAIEDGKSLEIKSA